MKIKKDIMGGPKKQFNLRMPIQLRRDINELASARNLKPSQVALGLLEKAVVNACHRCRGGLEIGSTPLHPKSCRFCFGTGRRDIAKIMRKEREGS